MCQNNDPILQCSLHYYYDMHKYILYLAHLFPCLTNSDDYYDTEDPSVNLHEFIVNSMQVFKHTFRLIYSETSLGPAHSCIERTNELSDT